MYFLRTTILNSLDYLVLQCQRRYSYKSLYVVRRFRPDTCFNLTHSTHLISASHIFFLVFTLRASLLHRIKQTFIKSLVLIRPKSDSEWSWMYDRTCRAVAPLFYLTGDHFVLLFYVNFFLQKPGKLLKESCIWVPGSTNMCISYTYM